LKKNPVSRIFLVIILIPVIILIAALIYYQFDDELRPEIAEIAEILNAVPVSIPTEQNAYYALLGLFTDKDIEPHAEGMNIYQQAIKMQSNSK
jgi:hypothetical protein